MTVTKESFHLNDALFDQILHIICKQPKKARFQVSANSSFIKMGILNDYSKVIFSFLGYQREKVIDMQAFRKSQSIIHQGYLSNLRDSRSTKSMLYVFNSQSNLLEYNSMQDYVDLITREIKEQGVDDLVKFKS